MRKFAISDPHGSYDEMLELFRAVDLDITKDQLVVIGDLIDRGPKTGELLQMMRDWQQRSSLVHVTLGNHEDMMLSYLNEEDNQWMYFGGVEAAKNINEVFKIEGVGSIIQWMKGLPLYFEDEEYIYAHAGINEEFPFSEKRSILWQSKKDFYAIEFEQLKKVTNGKIVIHGHTPTSNVTCDGIRINIDLGAQSSKKPKLALVELTEKNSYVYDFSTKEISEERILC